MENLARTVWKRLKVEGFNWEVLKRYEKILQKAFNRNSRK
jgi:hypothetical protein